MALYSRRGGAQLGLLQGSWPFARITVDPGIATVKLFARERIFTPEQVTRIEALGFLHYGVVNGVGIFYRGQHWEEHDVFYPLGSRAKLLDALAQAGFNVVREK